MRGQYELVLRDEKTNKEVTADGELGFGNQKTWREDYFWWTEGSFGCDCNRSSYFFSETVWDEIEEWPCSNKYNRFRIVKVITREGELPYSEDWNDQ